MSKPRLLTCSLPHACGRLWARRRLIRSTPARPRRRGLALLPPLPQASLPLLTRRRKRPHRPPLDPRQPGRNLVRRRSNSPAAPSHAPGRSSSKQQSALSARRRPRQHPTPRPPRRRPRPHLRRPRRLCRLPAVGGPFRPCPSSPSVRPSPPISVDLLKSSISPTTLAATPPPSLPFSSASSS